MGRPAKGLTKRPRIQKVRGRRPSLHPQRPSEDVWYYESRRGVEVYIHTPGLMSSSGNHVGTIGPIKIPWTMLARSSKRSYTKKRKIR